MWKRYEERINSRERSASIEGCKITNLRATERGFALRLSYPNLSLATDGKSCHVEPTRMANVDLSATISMY